MNKPQFNFGDLVRVNGYFPRLFEIDGRRIETWQYAEEQWTDIVYEVYDVLSSDWVECVEEDITLVAEADKADDYLATNPPHYEVPAQEKPEWMTFMFGGDETMSKAKEPRKPTAREISAKEAEEKKAARKSRGEEIDTLLEMAQWYRNMFEKTNDESYGDRLFAVEAELKRLVETE
jgi:hypothetical protein